MNKPPYQEEADSAVTHLGFTYRLNPLLRLGADMPTDYVHVSEMAWLLTPMRRTAMDPSRVTRADLKAPILVLRFGGRLFILDGLHRLALAMDEKRLMLPSKILSPVHLREEFLITPTEVPS